jgi:hypothetical protein
MKLNYFSEQTLPKQKGRGRRGLARVTFGKKGVISFNPQACELMGIKDRDKITLAQDEEDPKNWYFFKDSQHGFEVRSGYKGRGGIFNHRTMVHEFLVAFEMDESISHSFLIGGEPTVIAGSKTKYWGILI